MSGSESDIEIHSKLTKKNVKMPSSPSENIVMAQEKPVKKITTKAMIINALKELKSRKGTSIYAIKKYLEDTYQVNPDKSKYLIKKSIKTGIEEGIIIQVKGIGASGSFKLGKIDEKKVKKPKPKKVEEKVEKKETKSKTEKPKKTMEKPKKTVEKTVKKDTKIKAKKIVESKVKKVKITEEIKEKSKPLKKTLSQEKDKMEKKKSKVKIQTPAKKKSTMMKRKSIGSIIKPPKMKPKKT